LESIDGGEIEDRNDLRESEVFARVVSGGYAGGDSLCRYRAGGSVGVFWVNKHV